MVVVNIYNSIEDGLTVTRAIEDGYEFVGADSDPVVRDSRLRFSFNYFRLGDFESSEEPSSASVQRRIVIVDGSTSELLFSLTPEGIGGVSAQVRAEEQTIFDAINSVEFVSEVEPEINITEVSLIEDVFRIEFESTPGMEEGDFRFFGSQDLSSFDLNLSAQTAFEVVDAEQGIYQADIEVTGLDDPLFFRIEIPE